MQTLGSNLDGLLLKFLVPNKFREGCHFIPTDRRCAGPAVSSTSRADGEPDCYGRLTNEIPWDNMTYKQTKTYSKITNQSVSKISVTTLDWIRIYESSVQAVLQLLLSRQSLSWREAIGDSVDICWYPYLSLSICHQCFDVEISPSTAHRLIIPKRQRCFPFCHMFSAAWWNP